MASIHLDQIGHSYGTAVYALEKTDIHFEDGKTYALLGPSGCGKTTMLNIISGLLTPSDGRVVLGGTDVTRTRTAERNIAQVFQFPVVYQSKTVFENLASQRPTPHASSRSCDRSVTACKRAFTSASSFNAFVLKMLMAYPRLARDFSLWSRIVKLWTEVLGRKGRRNFQSRARRIHSQFTSTSAT